MSQERRMTVERWLETFTPYLVRIVARDRKKRRAPLARKDIAARAGRTEEWVDEISRLKDWSKVTWGDIKAFLKGTGFDLRKCNRERLYLMRTQMRMTHIDRLPPKERAFIEELISSNDKAIADIMLREFTR